MMTISTEQPGLNAQSIFSANTPEWSFWEAKNGLDIAFEDADRYAHGGPSMQQGDFSFVTSVNRAPMWIHKELFRQHLHHIDFSFAPFQFDDSKLCARAWLNGLQVDGTMPVSVH